ncbi:type II secretion system F family protein [Gordonia sp. (in: high G+C Gram-positive bacteria)]|uniref:type II secretion system F family protein n=1 Tax=Gordonia sp. (in: high G+C Gram-positive bacteria) TaxID=84139 RepID=UPI001DE61B51|nr:type II secretion system F family protein [Gordonia sp. (in: high G+C Gram-positive bacteria)]MCB1295713.1 type II secretion system F family protein [Gordonia sp. (in: high G+C Gram-positive bacteria)]HMS76943.1 type II secretion system F family protein [Gordonia sp. (in: high G+C Gram-positive bacteria)]HQV21269.1 type II secretion system F family protein [Gordonia sp. (in: high G+C Gram-positive bacteria)]
MNAPVVVAGLCAAGALLLWPSPEWLLHRIVPDGSGNRKANDSIRYDDPFTVAAALDLFAVCLRSGLPVESATRIVAAAAPESLAAPMSTAADLLALGADPDHAWTMAADESDVESSSGTGYFRELAMLVRRSSRAGASLTAGVDELAVEIRRRAEDLALEKAERAGVAISGPLGLCFLPAFVCLGIVPVVVGLAGGVFAGSL